MDESMLNAGRKRMDEVVEMVKQDLMGVQTGRAKPALVESIKVEAYEASYMEIKELGSISAPDPHSIVIKPWDSSVLPKIAKALQEENLGINPVVDRDIIRIAVPSLTEERRSELVKLVKQKIESGKAFLRQIRVEVKQKIDDQKDQAGVSEDDIHRLYDQLQKIMDEYNLKLEEIEKNKEQELMAL
ncbi:MAG: ribosome recycling factor [Candidatus Beckwithbacteria bacterium]